MSLTHTQYYILIFSTPNTHLTTSFLLREENWNPEKNPRSNNDSGCQTQLTWSVQSRNWTSCRHYSRDVEWSLQKVKYQSNFMGLQVSFFLAQKAVSESRILKTKEISEIKASQAHKKCALSWSLAKSKLDHSTPLTVVRDECSHHLCSPVRSLIMWT